MAHQHMFHNHLEPFSRFSPSFLRSKIDFLNASAEKTFLGARDLGSHRRVTWKTSITNDVALPVTVWGWDIWVKPLGSIHKEMSSPFQLKRVTMMMLVMTTMVVLFVLVLLLLLLLLFPVRFPHVMFPVRLGILPLCMLLGGSLRPAAVEVLWMLHKKRWQSSWWSLLPAGGSPHNMHMTFYIVCICILVWNIYVIYIIHNYVWLDILINLHSI